MQEKLTNQNTGGAKEDRTPDLMPASHALPEHSIANAAPSDDLEPQRQLHFKLWLAENPGVTEGNFNEKIWPHFRASILKQRAEPIEIKPPRPKRKTIKKRAIKRPISKRKVG